MTTSLITQGDDRQIQELILGLQDEARERFTAQDQMERLRENQNDIYFPPDVPKDARVEYHCGAVGSQIGLVHGLMVAQMPTIKVFHDGHQASKAQAEAIESWDNTLWPTLEMQAGELIWSMVLYDVLSAGFGVDVLDFLPSRLTESNGFPDSKKPITSKEDAQKYIDARTSAKRRAGGAMGKLPLCWRHVPARSFTFRESPDSPNLALACEARLYVLKDLLEDPRYADKLPKLRKYYDSKTDRERSALRGAKVLFYIIEDSYWTTYYAMAPELASLSGSDGDVLRTQSMLAQQYPSGEICDQFPNPLGRPRYILTRGLSVVSSNPALKYRSIMWDLRHNVTQRDNLVSWNLALEKMFAFPIPVVKRATVQMNGVEVTPGEDPGGQRKAKELKFHPGGNEITELDVGEELYFAVPTPSQTRDGLLAIMRSDADLSSIPSSVFNVDGSTAGYTYNSLLTTVLSRLKGIIDNVGIGHKQRVDTAHEILVREVKEPLTVVMSDQKTGQATWLDLGPDDLQAESLNIVPLYSLKKETDEMTRVQVFLAKTTPGRELTDVETARAEAGYENHEEIEQALLVKQVMAQPKVQELLMQKGSELALRLIDQKLASERAMPTDLMQQIAPGLAAAIGLSAGPGDPNARAVQGYAESQVGQDGQAPGGPPPEPPANPQMAQPEGPGTGMGRLPGQSGQPGGPNGTGGLG